MLDPMNTSRANAGTYQRPLSEPQLLELILTAAETQRTHVRHIHVTQMSDVVPPTSNASAATTDGKNRTASRRTSLEQEAYEAFKAEKAAQEKVERERSRRASRQQSSLAALEQARADKLVALQAARQPLPDDRLKKFEGVDQIVEQQHEERMRQLEEQEADFLKAIRDTADRRARQIKAMEDKTKFLHLSLEEKAEWLASNNITATPGPPMQDFDVEPVETGPIQQPSHMRNPSDASLSPLQKKDSQKSPKTSTCSFLFSWCR